MGEEIAAPIARVLPILGLSHLDRPFDYRVSAEQDAQAQPGVRVRVRFSGRLVDGFVLERAASSDHAGKLGPLYRVVSPEVVLTPELLDLCRAVAARYGGLLGDVLRLAIPPRHGRTETAVAAKELPDLPPLEPPDESGWKRYVHGDRWLTAVSAQQSARAVWSALPGEDWTARIVEAAQAAVRDGGTAIVVVPDQRDLDRLSAQAAPVFGDGLVTLAAGLGPSARYRRWLLAKRGAARLLVGTRSTVFTPVPDLKLLVLWDDGDDSYCEPRAPYPHAREVAVLRSHVTGCPLLLGGFARSTTAAALVHSGWAHSLAADRSTVRAAMPRVQALDDSDRAIARDPLARSARIPEFAFAAVRRALDADSAVLVSVPRRGYQPAIACARCREQVRCRHCHGPVGSDGPHSMGCRWCGRPVINFRCGACGHGSVRAMQVGAARTAEEIGRAFTGAPVVTSAGDHIVDEIPPGARVVIATPGAEPRAPGGYGAALILDTSVQLGRIDLAAGEDAVRRWLTVAAGCRSHSEGGSVCVVADSSLAPVQALIRWDPIGFANAELDQRAEVGFPPAVAMASIDGPPELVTRFAESVDLPSGGVVLGPVPLPPGVRPPAGVTDADGPIERILLRVDRRDGPALARAIAHAQVLRSARGTGARGEARGGRASESVGIRVQVDPPRIG